MRKMMNMGTSLKLKKLVNDMNGAVLLLVLALIFNTGLQVARGFMIEKKDKEITALKDEIDEMKDLCPANQKPW